MFWGIWLSWYFRSVWVSYHYSFLGLCYGWVCAPINSMVMKITFCRSFWCIEASLLMHIRYRGTVNVFLWFVLLDSAHLHLSVNLCSTCLWMWIYIWHLWTVCSTYICFVVIVDYDVVVCIHIHTYVCVYVVRIWKMFMSSTVYMFVVQYSGGDGSLPCTWLMLWTCMSNNFIPMIASY